jgi:hypothetical protein
MSSLASIRAKFAAFEPVTKIQIEIKSAMAVFINAEPQLGDDDCIAGIREDIPPNVLYASDALQGPSTLHRLIRQYLQLKGAVYTQHPENNRITFGLTIMIYDN